MRGLTRRVAAVTLAAAATMLGAVVAAGPVLADEHEVHYEGRFSPDSISAEHTTLTGQTGVNVVELVLADGQLVDVSFRVEWFGSVQGLDGETCELTYSNVSQSGPYDVHRVDDTRVTATVDVRTGTRPRGGGGCLEPSRFAAFDQTLPSSLSVDASDPDHLHGSVTYIASFDTGDEPLPGVEQTYVFDARPASGSGTGTEGDDEATPAEVAAGVAVLGGAAWAGNRGVKRVRRRRKAGSDARTGDETGTDEEPDAPDEPDDPYEGDPCGVDQRTLDTLVGRRDRYQRERDELTALLDRIDDQESFVLWIGRGKAVVDTIDAARKAGLRATDAIISAMKGGDGIIDKPQALELLDRVREGQSQLRNRIFELDLELDGLPRQIERQRERLARCREEFGR